MGYAYLLNTETSLATFRQMFNIPEDVDVTYCHESEIALHRGANTVFFPFNGKPNWQSWRVLGGGG